MTLIKLRIKGAPTCSVPATWRVAYSLPAPLVVLPTDTLEISLSLSLSLFLSSLSHSSAFKPLSLQQRSPSRLKRQPPHVLLVLAFSRTNGATRSLPPSPPYNPLSPFFLYRNSCSSREGERERERERREGRVRWRELNTGFSSHRLSTSYRSMQCILNRPPASRLKLRLMHIPEVCSRLNRISLVKWLLLASFVLPPY